MNAARQCGACHGKGTEPCPACGGRGKLGGVLGLGGRPCPVCESEGGFECSVCHGESLGASNDNRAVDVAGPRPLAVSPRPPEAPEGDIEVDGLGERPVPRHGVLMEHIAARDIDAVVAAWDGRPDHEQQAARFFLLAWLRDPKTRSDTREFAARLVAAVAPEGSHTCVRAITFGVERERRPAARVAMVGALVRLRAVDAAPFLRELSASDPAEEVRDAARRALRELS